MGSTIEITGIASESDIAASESTGTTPISMDAAGDFMVTVNAVRKLSNDIAAAVDRLAAVEAAGSGPGAGAPSKMAKLESATAPSVTTVGGLLVGTVTFETATNLGSDDLADWIVDDSGTYKILDDALETTDSLFRFSLNVKATLDAVPDGVALNFLGSSFFGADSATECVPQTAVGFVQNAYDGTNAVTLALSGHIHRLGPNNTDPNYPISVTLYIDPNTATEISVLDAILILEKVQ